MDFFDEEWPFDGGGFSSGWICQNEEDDSKDAGFSGRFLSQLGAYQWRGGFSLERQFRSRVCATRNVVRCKYAVGIDVERMYHERRYG